MEEHHSQVEGLHNQEEEVHSRACLEVEGIQVVGSHTLVVVARHMVDIQVVAHHTQVVVHHKQHMHVDLVVVRHNLEVDTLVAELPEVELQEVELQEGSHKGRGSSEAELVGRDLEVAPHKLAVAHSQAVAHHKDLEEDHMESSQAAERTLEQDHKMVEDT